MNLSGLEVPHENDASSKVGLECSLTGSLQTRKNEYMEQLRTHKRTAVTEMGENAIHVTLRL